MPSLTYRLQTRPGSGPARAKVAARPLCRQDRPGIAQTTKAKAGVGDLARHESVARKTGALRCIDVY